MGTLGYGNRSRAGDKSLRVTPWVPAAVAIALLMLTTGCEYASKDLYPPDLQTIAVPIFENRSFYRGIEFDLTEALIKEIERRTPYKVTSSASADTIMMGTLVSVSQKRLSRRRAGGVPEELEMRLVVDFQWKNLKTGQPIRQRSGFEAVGRYIPAQPIAETLEVAQHQAVQLMAQQIVSVMAANW